MINSSMHCLVFCYRKVFKRFVFCLKFVLYLCSQICSLLMDLLNKYFSWRDYSGSEQDSYAQDIETFYNQSVLHNEEDGFLALLEKAEKEHKKIVYIPIEGTFSDDIFVKQLTLA